MQFELKNKAGEVIATGEIPTEELVQQIQAKLNDSSTSEVATLKEEVARLSDPDREKEIVRAWAAGLNSDAYVELGKQLGLIAEVAEPAPAEEDPPNPAPAGAVVAEQEHTGRLSAVEVPGKSHFLPNLGLYYVEE